MEEKGGQTQASIGYKILFLACPLLLETAMVGIAIYADSIRAVRLSKVKKQYILKADALVELYEDTIVQGRLRNAEAFMEALRELKDKMKIGEDEEVFVGLPNGISTIRNVSMEGGGTPNPSLIDDIPIMGNNKIPFDIEIPFISGDYRVGAPYAEEDFDPDDPNANSDEAKQENQEFQIMRTVSYCIIKHAFIEEYTNAFTTCGFNIVSMEPNAVAIARYLRDEATQPFIVVDIEYDYTSFIMFSEKHGLYMLNSQNTGDREIISYEYDEEGNIIDQNLNFIRISEICKRIRLTENYYIENAMTQEDAYINQIIFLNRNFNFVIDEVIKEFQGIEVLSAQDMIPASISQNSIPSKILDNNLYLFYIPMMIAMNNGTSAFSTNSFDRDVEMNIVPKQCREEATYKRIKNKIMTGMIALAGVAGVFLLGTVGWNLQNIYSNPDAAKVNAELRQKYEDAKKQSTIMKENILKYNTIAVNKYSATPIVDMIISSKPKDVSIVNMDINFKKDRAIMSCVTNTKSSQNDYLQELKANDVLQDAQILNSKTKGNVTAFQVSIPLSTR